MITCNLLKSSSDLSYFSGSYTLTFSSESRRPESMFDSADVATEHREIFRKGNADVGKEVLDVLEEPMKVL